MFFSKKKVVTPITNRIEQIGDFLILGHHAIHIEELLKYNDFSISYRESSMVDVDGYEYYGHKDYWCITVDANEETGICDAENYEEAQKMLNFILVKIAEKRGNKF